METSSWHSDKLIQSQRCRLTASDHVVSRVLEPIDRFKLRSKPVALPPVLPTTFVIYFLPLPLPRLLHCGLEPPKFGTGPLARHTFARFLAHFTCSLSPLHSFAFIRALRCTQSFSPRHSFVRLLVRSLVRSLLGYVGKCDFYGQIQTVLNQSGLPSP